MGGGCVSVGELLVGGFVSRGFLLRARATRGLCRRRTTGVPVVSCRYRLVPRVITSSCRFGSLARV